MLTLASWLLPLMGVVWYGAATGWASATWLRWVVVGPALLLGALVRFAVARRTLLPPLLLPLVLVVAYGLLLSGTSALSDLALWKATAFGVTALACLLAGANAVDRLGRERVLRLWRWAWRGLLAYSLLSVATGRWGFEVGGLAGPTGNPNMYASLLASFGLVLVAREYDASPAWLLALEGAGGAGLLLATRSRASMGGVAAAVVLAVLLGRGARRWLTASALAVVCALALVVTPERSVTEVEDVLDVSGGRSVFATRASTWDASWKAMVAGLPFGFGWGVKEVPSRTWTLGAVTTGYGREEGTSWLPVGEELGLPGFALWAWIWWCLLRAALRSPAPLRPLALGALAYYAVLATFEGWMLSPGSWECWAFWATAGVVLARPRAHAVGPPAASPVLPPVLESPA